MPVTVAEKIQEAEACRLAGNELFKAKEFKKAILKYNRVFAFINGLVVEDQMEQYQRTLKREAPTPEEADAIQGLELNVWSNQALCYFKLKQWRKVLDVCSKILERNPHHSKALFNQGRAFMQLKDLDLAKRSLTEAAALVPNDVLIQKELQRLTALYRQQDEKEKKTWAHAFKKM